MRRAGMAREADARYLDELRSDTRRVLRETLGKEPLEIALLDVPIYRNLGDSMIWQGTVNYLESLGHHIVLTGDAWNFNDSDFGRLSRDAIIVLQGGGNMGDLYPLHEEFRRHVVISQPARRIVIMPQSLHFRDSLNRRESARVYAGADNLTLLLRDSRSMDAADRHFSNIEHKYCPDLALGLEVAPLLDRAVSKGMHESYRSASTRIVVLGRKDDEATAVDKRGDVGLGANDWSAPGANRVAFTFLRKGIGARHRAPRLVRDRSGSLGEFVYRSLRHLDIGAAIKQVEGARFIATNRLHAHILAILLDVPHAVADNSYGKISAIFEDYTGRFSTAHWADSLDDAAAMAPRYTAV